jgi:hypothetical protein
MRTRARVHGAPRLCPVALHPVLPAFRAAVGWAPAASSSCRAVSRVLASRRARGRGTAPDGQYCYLYFAAGGKCQVNAEPEAVKECARVNARVQEVR